MSRQIPSEKWPDIATYSILVSARRHANPVWAPAFSSCGAGRSSPETKNEAPRGLGASHRGGYMINEFNDNILMIYVNSQGLNFYLGQELCNCSP